MLLFVITVSLDPSRLDGSLFSMNTTTVVLPYAGHCSSTICVLVLYSSCEHVLIKIVSLPGAGPPAHPASALQVSIFRLFVPFHIDSVASFTYVTGDLLVLLYLELILIHFNGQTPLRGSALMSDYILPGF